MADRFAYRVANKAAALKFFANLRDEVKFKAVKLAATAGIKPIFEEMVRRVPERTGGLKKSLRFVVTLKPRKGSAEAKAGPTKKGAHAVFLEFGTVKMPAQPFMRPAADAKAEEAAQRAFDVYEKFIARIAAKGIR